MEEETDREGWLSQAVNGPVSPAMELEMRNVFCRRLLKHFDQCHDMVRFAFLKNHSGRI